MTEATETTPRRHLAPARRWGLVVGVAVAVIALDRLSKWWALDRLSGGEVIELIGSLQLQLAFNTGMAFSKGSGSGAIIGVVAIGIVAVLAFVARKVDSRMQLLLIGIVMGGAIGNIIDRVVRVGAVNPFTGETAVGFMSGAVVDFIDVQWWPVFNIADAAVVCGGIALAVLSARVPADEPSGTTGHTASEPGVDTSDSADSSDPAADESDAPRS